MTKTKIEWADMVLNPLVGCEKESAGCVNCYAEKMAWRLAYNPKLPEQTRAAYQAVVTDGKWNGEYAIIESQIDKIRRVKGKKVFIGSMTDMFRIDVRHDKKMRDCLVEVWDATQHNGRSHFLFLTKRPQNIPDWYQSENKWLGVTVESQDYIERIEVLLANSDKNRFVSVEPMLSEVRIPFDLLSKLSWVICGAETGANARVIYPAWVWKLRNDCAVARVPFFFKKWNQSPHLIDGELDGKVCRDFPKEMI